MWKVYILLVNCLQKGVRFGCKSGCLVPLKLVIGYNGENLQKLKGHYSTLATKLALQKVAIRRQDQNGQKSPHLWSGSFLSSTLR